jgi:hypothetical protein
VGVEVEIEVEVEMEIEVGVEMEIEVGVEMEIEVGVKVDIEVGVEVEIEVVAELEIVEPVCINCGCKVILLWDVRVLADGGGEVKRRGRFGTVVGGGSPAILYITSSFVPPIQIENKKKKKTKKKNKKNKKTKKSNQKLYTYSLQFHTF